MGSINPNLSIKTTLPTTVGSSQTRPVNQQPSQIVSQKPNPVSNPQAGFPQVSSPQNIPQQRQVRTYYILPPQRPPASGVPQDTNNNTLENALLIFGGIGLVGLLAFFGGRGLLRGIRTEREAAQRLHRVQQGLSPDPPEVISGSTGSGQTIYSPPLPPEPPAVDPRTILSPFYQRLTISSEARAALLRAAGTIQEDELKAKIITLTEQTNGVTGESKRQMAQRDLVELLMDATSHHFPHAQNSDTIIEQQLITPDLSALRQCLRALDIHLINPVDGESLSNELHHVVDETVDYIQEKAGTISRIIEPGFYHQSVTKTKHPPLTPEEAAQRREHAIKGMTPQEIEAYDAKQAEKNAAAAETQQGSVYGHLSGRTDSTRHASPREILKPATVIIHRTTKPSAEVSHLGAGSVDWSEFTARILAAKGKNPKDL